MNPFVVDLSSSPFLFMDCSTSWPKQTDPALVQFIISEFVVITHNENLFRLKENKLTSFIYNYFNPSPSGQP